MGGCGVQVVDLGSAVKHRQDVKLELISRGDYKVRMGLLDSISQHLIAVDINLPR